MKSLQPLQATQLTIACPELQNFMPKSNKLKSNFWFNILGHAKIQCSSHMRNNDISLPCCLPMAYGLKTPSSNENSFEEMCDLN